VLVRVRHGFSAVPRWRSRGILGVAISAALIAELFVATSAAYAAPEAPAQPEPARGKRFITQDIDGHHRDGLFKMATSIVRLMNEKTRMGTFDYSLNKVAR
jgi:hypothetical protein